MRKITAVLVALTLALGMSGCGANQNNPTEPAGPTEPPYKTVYVRASITQEFGSAVSRTEYVFDEADRVTEVIVYTNDQETKRYDVECDAYGNYTHWTSDGSTMEYTYDAAGHSLGRAIYNDGVLVSSTTYVWENDLQTSVITQMAGQDMTQKVLMTYDSAGNLLRQDSYSAETLVNYSIYAYDDQGRVATMTTYQPDGSLYSIGKYGWESKNLTITTTGPDGSVMQTAVRTYDDAGNLLTHTVFNALGDQVSKETHTWKELRVDPDCPRASV